jgi:hypothetical protein
MFSQAEDTQYAQPRFIQMEQNTFTAASASSKAESPQHSQPLQTQIGSNTYHTASVATRPSFQEELDSVKSTCSYTDMLAGNDHFVDEVNEIAEDEARYPLQEESGYLPRIMREKLARPSLADGTESPPIPTQIKPGREHWVRTQAATGELRFSRITERPVPLRNRNIGKVQAARPPVHLQPEDFSTYVPTQLTNVSKSQGNDNTDRIVAQVIAAMTPLLEASEVRITANMKDIHISLLPKIADLDKIVKAQDK